jgi:hypothetical protein
MQETAAVVKIDVPPSFKDARDADIKVEMQFGRAELVLKAWEASSGVPVKAKIKFAQA